MTDSLLASSREVLYKQYHTGELVQATILGSSTQGEELVCLKYTRNGCDYENPSAPLSAVQFPLRSPSPMSSSQDETPQRPPPMIVVVSMTLLHKRQVYIQF